MLKYIRTDCHHKDFIRLVALLNADLKIRDREENAFYAQFNNIDVLKNVVIAYSEDKAIGCGAFKRIAEGVEIKRMYVAETGRRKGIASGVLSELEMWALELGEKTCVLETGKRQPEAIALYQKRGYNLIPNYGHYKGIENSVCFEKKMDH